MRKFLWGAVLTAVFMCVNVQAATFDPGVDYRQLKSEHFHIYYEESLEPLAQRVAYFAEEAHAILSPKYDWKPLGRTTAILTDNYDQSNGFATVVPYNSMMLYVPAPEPYSVLGHYDDWLRLLVVHEYLHILHMGQVGGLTRIPRALLGTMVAPNGTLPAWLREGLAVYEETLQGKAGRVESSFSSMLLRTAVLNKDWPGIDVAEGFGWKWPRSYGPYLFGGMFVDWLANKYGEEKLIEYQKRSGRSLLLFMNNRHAKKVWGKRWRHLWQEWQADMTAQYQPQLKSLERRGLTKFSVVSEAGDTISALSLSPQANTLVYAAQGPHQHAQLRLRDLSDDTERVLVEEQEVTSTSYDPSGTRIAYAAAGAHKRYYLYSDIYIYNLLEDKRVRITAGRRAKDPSFAPDGKSLLYVVDDAGTQQIVRYDFETKQETVVPIAAAPFTRFSRPQLSPSGKIIAVSSFQEGQHDLYIYRADGSFVTRLTNDQAIDHSPSWDAQGHLYFASDRSGISNVYRYHYGSGELEQITNVATGVSEPTVSADGKTLYAQYYNGAGFDLRKARIGRIYAQERAGGFGAADTAGDAVVTTEYPTKKYSPLGPQLLVPRMLRPGFLVTGSGAMFTLGTQAFDPLRRHLWVAGVSHRTDAKHTGYYASYTYNRFKPTFTLGVINYAAQFGPVPFDFNAVGSPSVQLYEKRIRGYASVSMPIRSHAFSLSYYFENRDNIPALHANTLNLLNLGNYAAVSVGYGWGRLKRYAASISHEQGHKVRANFTWHHAKLGSDSNNEQGIFAADVREFIPLPWQHHVLGLRLKGGVTFGDRLQQRTFGLGGSLGEGLLAGGGSLNYFPLRGTPVSSLVGERAVLASAEYRLPIVAPNRGVGTAPAFVKNIHAAFFVDYGNTWVPSGDGEFPIGDFLLSTGVELRGDFVMWHGLPITGRLGYGIVVHNNDRISITEDPNTKLSSKYGNVILQVGTSF